MISHHWSTSLLLLLLLSCSAVTAAAEEPRNLFKQARAAEEAGGWRAEGDGTIDGTTGALVVRSRGRFVQRVFLPDEAVGQYVVVIAQAASERINRDGAITGLPILYGTLASLDGVRIYGSLAGELRSSAKSPDEWVFLWGAADVPAGTKQVIVSLSQAEQQGIAQNGSAARFDNVGLYLFSSSVDARRFLAAKTGRAFDAIRAGREPIPVTPPCLLGLERAFPLYGIRLGQRLEEVLARFPKNRRDADVRTTAQQMAHAPEYLRLSLVIDPSQYPAIAANFEGVKVLRVGIIDGRVYSLHVDFDGPAWKSVDDFILKHRADLGLPEPDEWLTGSVKSMKYLICQGFEVRFYAAPVRPPNAPAGPTNTNYLEIIDNLAEKTLARP